MPLTQSEKARAFQALHERPGCFAIPKPWDAGTAPIGEIDAAFPRPTPSETDP